MNGYLRIKNTDLYERDGVTYWRNGGNIIGNVVKAVIEENDVVTSETYYIESLKTAKAIMLDPDVKIGGLTASESKNGNFIIVETAPADFTEYGGGTGLKITFIYGVNYYSIETVESNGDIKIYDPDGESGTITPDALPDTTDAAVGDALVLDSDKKPTWGSVGGHIFLHMHSSVASGRTAFAWYFDSNPSTDWRTFLTRNGYTDRSKPWGCCSGYVKDGNTEYPVCGMFILSSTELGLRYDVGSSSLSLHGYDSFFNDNTITYQLI